MARGIARSSLIDTYYDELQAADKLPADKTVKQVRATLSNELGTAQPGHQNFAAQKFGEVIQVEQHLMRETYTEQHVEQLDEFIRELGDQLDTARTLFHQVIEQCRAYLEDGEATPTTPQEFAAMVTTALKLADAHQKTAATYLQLTQANANPALTKEIA